MIPLERQRTILRLLNQQGTATIPELVDSLGVSHMTVRRDIAALENAGRVSSVAGGVALPSRALLDQAHSAKAELHPDAKRAIGKIAASLVSGGDVIFLDAGTTTLAVATELAERSDLMIVTNDLVVAQYLADNSGSQLFLAAGMVDKANLSTEGPSTAAALAPFNFDITFLSTPAFDLRGASIQSEAKRAVKRTATEQAETTYLVSDSSKYGRVMPFQAVATHEMEGIITDDGLPESAKDAFEEAGLRVLIAQSSTQ